MNIWTIKKFITSYTQNITTLMLIHDYLLSFVQLFVLVRESFQKILYPKEHR